MDGRFYGEQLFVPLEIKGCSERKMVGRGGGTKHDNNKIMDLGRKKFAILNSIILVLSFFPRGGMEERKRFLRSQMRRLKRAFLLIAV